MKEANKIIKRDSYYKGLSDKDAKRILTETEDHIFGRDVDMDPEDFFATGGRVGLRGGGADMGGVADSQGNVGSSFGGGNNDGPDDRSTAAQTAAHNAAVAAAQEANTVEEKMNILDTLSKFRPNTFVNPYDYSVNLNKNIGPFGLNVGINTLGMLGIDDPRTEEDESEQPDYGINAGYNTDVFGGKFMKIAAGVASIPIVGKFFKPAKVAKTVSKVPLVKTPPVPGKPEWFDALVNKVILEGDDVTKNFATKDREIVHVKQLGEGEGARVTRDLDDGTIRVEYESPTNLGEEPVIMEYKPGMADETTGGKKPTDEFKVVETEPQYVGGPEDADIEFIGENVVNSVDDIVSDTSSLKQFATGKLDPKDLAVRKEKVKKTQAINNDQMEQAEFIENKYGGPIDYNDPMDFASGGLAYLLGE
jgi:hypothetical protein